jgi:hypothetical protein
MKSFAKTATSFFGLFIVLFFFVFGVYAQSNYTDILASNKNISKRILRLKSTTSSVLKLAHLEEQSSAKQIQVVSNQASKSYQAEVSETKHRQLEEWMFDEFFWQVTFPVWNEEVREEQKEIESWMMNISVTGHQTTGSNAQTMWVQKHSFFIL